MLLKSGGNIIKSGSSLLKRSENGNVLYQLNLATFDTTTMRDGNIQWTYSNRAPILEKRDDRLIIRFSEGEKQYFWLNLIEQLNILSYPSYSIEYTYGGSLPWMSFFGLDTCALKGKYGIVEGIWTRRNGGWSTAFGLSVPVPITCKALVTQNSSISTVELYINGSLLGTTTVDTPDSITHNVDYNGSAANGTIELYSLKIEKL